MIGLKKVLFLGLAIGSFSACTTAAPQAAEALKIIYVSHSDSGNAFWLTVKKGMDDACALVHGDCQMIFVSKSGDVQGQVANIEAAIAQKPDEIITTITDNKAFNAVVKEAVEQGITVVASNVDAPDGGKVNARAAFVGQDFVAAGYALGKAASAKFPANGPIRVLVGVNMPQESWSQRRAAGVLKFLEEYKAAHPERDIAWDKIDAGTDYGTAGDRFGNYLTGAPDLTAYFDTGFWDVGVVKVLKDRGIKPGKILVSGFDLVPDVLNEMKAGYIQFTIDQQPYLQGYLPVIQASLVKQFKLSPFDVNTGSAVVTPDQVDKILQLSKDGYR
jgi:simple sugar transport system substrate-binding protein